MFSSATRSRGPFVEPQGAANRDRLFAASAKTAAPESGRFNGSFDRVDYSAAMRTSGAAAITSGVTWVSNFWKFFWNMPTNARAVLSKSALFFHVFIGCKRCGSTPGTEVCNAHHKNGAWG